MSVANPDEDVTVAAPTAEGGTESSDNERPEPIAEELLIEEIFIDGMCGIY